MSLAALACGGGSPPASQAKNALELGLAQTSHAIVGRDGASSGRAFGHDVWAFGDTVMNAADEEGSSWHYNSFALTDAVGSPVDATFNEVTLDGGALQYFIAPTPAEDAFNTAHRGDNCMSPPCSQRWAVWPGSMVFDDANHRLVIAYGLIPPDGEVGGASFAVWSQGATTPERLGVSDSAPHGITLFTDQEAAFGESPALIDGQLYAFANTKHGFGYSASLGRVPVEQLLERSAWTYWDGRTWSASPNGAQTLFDSGLGFNTFYDAHLGVWVALYAAPFSNDVMFRTAKVLEGPWSAQALLFTADRKTGDPGVYDCYAHIELSPDDGRTVYVTFSRPDGNGWFGSEIVVMQVTFEP